MSSSRVTELMAWTTEVLRNAPDSVRQDFAERDRTARVRAQDTPAAMTMPPREANRQS